MNIGIIGTAGRNQDGLMLSKKKFGQMLVLTRNTFPDIKEHTLVSGGAAYADHVAVTIYLFGGCADLILHLPCLWDNERKQFLDNGSANWQDNPGKTSNRYHRLFSKNLGVDENYSLEQIDTAIKKGAKVSYGGGFFARNTEVAKDSDKLLAMTFGKGGKVADGGTRDTFQKYIKMGKKEAQHIDLTAMQVFPAV